MSTPTPEPWIADGYELRQKHGRMIAYFGPHHTPADEYPMSCRLQDEANCQWVAAARNELAAARNELAAASQAYDRVMAIHGTVLEDLAAEREKVRVLQEALALAAESGELTGWYFQQARAALAATKEASK